MSTVPVEVQVSSADLLKAVSQLPLSDLEQFVFQVLTLQAKRKAPSLPPAEADLLTAINQGLPAEAHARYAQLIEQRQAEALTPNDYQELLRLTEQVEQFEVQRLTALAELARLRHTTLTELADTLNLRTPTYA